MRRRNLVAFLIAVYALILGPADADRARAAGYWNMPGTHAQRAGHGFGGGYHAPLVLGPVRFDGWHLGTPVRLPHAPSPYYGWECCGDCGRIIEAPSSMDGVVPTTEPTPAEQTTAVPAETRKFIATRAATTENAAIEPEPVVAPPVEAIGEPKRPLFPAPVQH